MKRSIAIFMTFIANIILLAHIVVPHHFASQPIEFCNVSLHKLSSIADFCPHTDNQSVSQNTEAKGNHDIAIEDCQLEDIHIRLSKEKYTLNPDECDISPEVLQIAYFITELLTPQVCIKEDLFKQYTTPNYSFEATISVGLRAPPHKLV